MVAHDLRTVPIKKWSSQQFLRQGSSCTRQRAVAPGDFNWSTLVSNYKFDLAQVVDALQIMRPSAMASIYGLLRDDSGNAFGGDPKNSNLTSMAVFQNLPRSERNLHVRRRLLFAAALMSRLKRVKPSTRMQTMHFCGW